jgi:hypothetical protein
VNGLLCGVHCLIGGVLGGTSNLCRGVSIINPSPHNNVDNSAVCFLADILGSMTSAPMFLEIELPASPGRSKDMCLLVVGRSEIFVSCTRLYIPNNYKTLLLQGCVSSLLAWKSEYHGIWHDWESGYQDLTAEVSNYLIFSIGN